MSKITVKLPSAESVSPGSTASFRLPIGATYEQVITTYSGTTFNLSHMAEIRVVGNGKTIMRFPTIGAKSGGQVLDAWNQFEGRAAANGVLVLDFNRFGIRTRANEELTGLGTGFKRNKRNAERYRALGGTGVELSTLYLEIDIKSTAVAPVLSAKAVQSPRRPLGLIKEVRAFGYTANASGDFEISDLPRGDLINKFGIFSADVNAVKVETDRNVRFERTTAENELIQSDGVRVPQAGLWVYDPSEIGNGSEALPTKRVQDLRVTVDMAAPGAVPVLVEYLGTLER